MKLPNADDLRARVARLTAESEAAAAARAQLPPGTSRRRVTSANAKWARKAEARDAAMKELAALEDRQRFLDRQDELAEKYRDGSITLDD